MACCICRKNTPLSVHLCENCEKIRTFVDIWGIDTVLCWIYRYTNEAEMYGRIPLIRKNL